MLLLLLLYGPVKCSEKEPVHLRFFEVEKAFPELWHGKAFSFLAGILKTQKEEYFKNLSIFQIRNEF